MLIDETKYVDIPKSQFYTLSLLILEYLKHLITHSLCLELLQLCDSIYLTYTEKPQSKSITLSLYKRSLIFH